MAIDSVSGSVAASYTQFSSTGAVAPRGQDSDGDNDGSTGKVRGGGGGRIANAIAQALSQLGGTASTSGTGGTSGTSGTDASGAAGTSTSAQQAESAFAHNLFAALHAQSGGANTPGAPQGSEHHHHSGAGGRLAAGLQSLAQQLSSSSGNSGTSGTSGSGGSQALSDLQTSFDNLLAANGQSGSGVTLSQFLQSLSQNLQGVGNSGNVVSTKA